MTDHQKLLMHFEQERIKDKRFMKQILKNCSEATMAFFDEPYPYIVPMNYGFEWKDTLIFYLHTAPDGHKNQLLRKNNRVALNIHQFLDRVGYKRVQGFDHDFRSVTCFGTAEIVRGDQEGKDCADQSDSGSDYRKSTISVAYDGRRGDSPEWHEIAGIRENE